MKLSGYQPRDLLGLRSECAIGYEAADHPEYDLSLIRSGQSMAMNRNSIAMGLAGDGTEYQVVAHQHRMEAVDTDGDGVYNTPGRILEPTRTNQWTFSRDLSNGAWTLNAATTSTDTTVGPDGITLAYKLKETAVNSTHYVSRTIGGTPTSNVRTCYSFAAKAAERGWVAMFTANKANAQGVSYVNLSTGALGTIAANHKVTVKRRRDGWWRIAVSFDMGTGATTPSMAVYIATADTTNSYLGVTGNGIYVTDLQCETDAGWPTSFIPTAGSTVQRLGDRWAGTLDWSSGVPNDVTMYASFARPPWMDHTANTGETCYFIGIGAIGSGQRLALYCDLVAKTIKAYIEGPGATTSIASTSIPATGIIECCVNLRNMLTVPEGRIDVGSGFTSYSGGATKLTVLANTTYSIGDLDNSSQQCGTPVLSARVVRDQLKTLAQMQGTR